MKSRRKEVEGLVLLKFMTLAIILLRTGLKYTKWVSNFNSKAKGLAKLKAASYLKANLARRRAAIVVPIYNNYKWTKRCLKSLSSLNELVEVDIWVIDDCSTDNSKDRIQAAFPGVKLITNSVNLGFLKSCNAAFQELEGTYDLIFLLNNDTEVLPGFFVEALSCLDAHPEAAMVGSRLLYPDGTLQEAGGLIWRSGNAWNFGRGDDSTKPEYMVDREVDYASGAALLIKTKELKDVGYFSPEFVPAYCEDSDLAFKLRAKGHQVWLAAKSNVIHFEGKSNGTSLSSGIKAHQEPNQRRLIEKWSKELDSHFDEGTHTGAQAAFRLSPASLPVGHYSSDPLESLFQTIVYKASNGTTFEKAISTFLFRLKDFYLANTGASQTSSKTRKKPGSLTPFSESWDALNFEQRGDPKFSPDSSLVVLLTVRCDEADHVARAYKGLIAGLSGEPIREVRVLNFSQNRNSASSLSTNPNLKISNNNLNAHNNKIIDSQIDELKDFSVLHLNCCSILSGSFVQQAQYAMNTDFPDFVVGKALFSTEILGEAGIQWTNGRATNPALGASRGDSRFDFGRAVTNLGSSPWLKGQGVSTGISAITNVWYEPTAVSFFQRTKDDLISEKPEKDFIQKSLGWLFGNKPAGVLLIIEDEIPKPDRHAGDVTVSQYLDVFLSEGFAVIYWPRHHSGWSSYRQTLLDKGVWVLDSTTNAELWLSTYGEALDAVWVARPHNASRLVPLIRKVSAARIVYYTHDLHFLREERQKTISPDVKDDQGASKTKEIEVGIFNSVDVVASPSESESLIIRELAPATKVVTLPPYFIDDLVDSKAGSKVTSNPEPSVIFVGGFPHTPNVNAALVLALEVMPIVWEKLPNAKLFLVGYAPPKEVQELANNQVIVTGQVPDLKPFLLAADVFCAPLTFGAGVKGKVVDALKTGLPVVGTAIAFEGMSLENNVDCLVAETSQEIANELIRVLIDKDFGQKIGANGQTAAKAQFSRDLGVSRVRQMALSKQVAIE